MKRIALSLVLLLWCVSADAAVGVAHFRANRAHSGEQWDGTAVCVGEAEDDGWFFLTARHNLEGLTFGVDQIRVQCRGEWIDITGFRLHPRLDLAAISLKCRHKLRYARIAESKRARGTVVTVAGHTRGGRLRIRKGRVARGAMFVPEGVYPGDSGGGVFDADDFLLGIITAHTEYNSQVVSISSTDIRSWYVSMDWDCPPCRPGQRQPPPPQRVGPPAPQPMPMPMPIPEPVDGTQCPKCEDGSDGNGVTRIWLDGNTFWAEYADGQTQEIGTVNIPSTPTIDLTGINARLDAIEAMRLTVRSLNSDGSVYGQDEVDVWAGEPIDIETSQLADLEAIIARLNALLELETPIRVWHGKTGKLLGEDKVRILQGEPIDLTFDPAVFTETAE